MSTPVTEIVKASEMGTRVVQRIFELRNPDAMPEYRGKLAQYKRRLGKREERKYTRSNGFTRSDPKPGFVVKIYDEDVFVERPQKPNPQAYSHSEYDRSFGFTTHARDYGLLADPAFNRDIRPQRVEEYAAEMEAGRWHDLLSDPISITEDGHVLNGQHRIAAVTRVNWSKAENDPVFLVVWGVSPQEALHADGSNRTARDEKTIATKLLTAAA